MNAYEIRYAVLCDARQMLQDQWHVAVDYAQSKGPSRFSSGGVEAEIDEPLPPAPTIEAIMKLANEMYDFVQQSAPPRAPVKG